ncbi:hypothetical protein [Streptosporangium sp. NPDC006930]|uniref:hypothetical protein n=1 Tax=unclassified Streptosporangium TaxID=2632669 RepID=UPI003431B4B9
MKRVTTVLARTALVLALGAGLPLVSSQAAQAWPAQCLNGENGFRDMPDNASGRYAVGFQVQTGAKPTYFSIQYGAPYGPAIGWAKIDGATSPGDRFWMDWTRDDRRTWIQCGPFSPSGYSLSATTPAQLTSTNSNWKFRVCGSVSGDATVRCSDWW